MGSLWGKLNVLISTNEDKKLKLISIIFQSGNTMPLSTMVFTATKASYLDIREKGFICRRMAAETRGSWDMPAGSL